jgi:predicted esterase
MMQTFESYTEMRTKVVELFQAEQYAEAVEILKWGIEAFPNHLEANCYNLALCYTASGKIEEALRSLQAGLDQGIWFSRYGFLGELWAPMRELDGFEALQEAYETRRQQAQKESKPRLVIETPKSYTPEKTYPLFIALHGGGENLEVFQPQWKSSKLEDEFIVAYLQSLQVMGNNRFAWEDLDLAEKEILEAYETVLQDFTVDPAEVLIGGFSDGGRASLALTTSETTLPLKGFVVLCPPIPETFTPEGAAKAQERGVRGTLLTTEMDQRLEDQKEMVAVFKAQGVAVRLVVTPDIGHWYPPDLGEQIDTAIKHIRGF